MNLPQRAFWRGSIILLCTNGIGGVLNYGYQVEAARRLSVVDFGLLNSWSADTGIMLSLGGLCQMLAHYFPLNRVRLAQLGLGVFLIAAIVTVWLTMLAANGGLTDWNSRIGALLMCIGASWLMGEMQLRLHFSIIGFCGLVGAATKFGIALIVFPQQSPATSFYLSLTAGLGFAAMILGLSVLLMWRQEDHINRPSTRNGARFTCAFILALSGALVPQMDLINLRLTQSAAIIGNYARSSLFAKAIFFSAGTALQVTLPLHIRNQNQIGSETQGIWRVELLIFVGCALTACGAAIVGPWLSRRLLGFDLDGYQSWILLTGLIATVLFGLLQRIQRDCAALDWRRGGLCLLSLSAMIGICRLMPPNGVVHYLIAAFCYYSVVLAVVTFRGKRPTKPNNTVGLPPAAAA